MAAVNYLRAAILRYISQTNKYFTMKIATTKERILQFIEYKGISKQAFFKETGLKRGFLDADKLQTSIPDTFIATIIASYPEINPLWLILGEGSMIKDEYSDTDKTRDKEGKNTITSKSLIPFYDNINTIGGINDCVATTDAVNPSEWIDAGDWFPEATSAIRHYGDSMVEYPSGSILALKRVHDPRLIMNGRNYVIETTEYRVTKQLQDEGDYFMAYSTNRETYPDGHQIHAPFPVPKDAILHIDLVLGCVTKEYSNGAILIRK